MDDATIAALFEAEGGTAASPPSDDGEEVALFGEDDFSQRESDPVAEPDPGERGMGEKKKSKKKRRKKSSKSRRARKRARMIALSNDDEIGSSSSSDAAPVAPRRRNRILVSSDDDGFFAEGDAPPATPPDSDSDSLSFDSLLKLGNGEPSDSDSDPHALPKEAEEDKSAGASTGDEVKMDVRAHEFVSAHPPTMVFMTGKTRATSVPVTLVGDLVRELSCPLHTFRVCLKPVPDGRSASGSPVLFVLDVEKIVAGPVPDAAKAATAAAVAAGSAIVGDSVAKVAVARLKRAVTSSNYLKNVQNKSALVSKLFHPLSEEFPNGMSMNAVALERFAPADGNTQISWMCRNALADQRFFDAANRVGGAAVRAVGRPAADTQIMWDAINGVGGAVEGMGGEGAVIELLKKIHFANPLSEFRAARLHEALGVPKSRELSDMAECIVRAAAIVHNLPSAADIQDDRYRNAIVRSELGEVWSEPVLRLLRWHGLHVDKDSSQRWYACRQQTRQFFSSVVESIGAGNVRFVRAEIDDDHNVAGEERGYIERVRGAVAEFKHNLLVLSKLSSRVGYLKRNTQGYSAKFLTYQAFSGTFAPGPNTVIWVDRAHLFNARELTRLLSDWSQTVKSIYLAGSVWAGTTRYESTLFAQLFAGSDSTQHETLTATLATYKAAPVGSNPLAEGAKERMPGTPIVVGRLAAACPPDIKAAYPTARVFSVAQLAEAIDVYSPAAIVLFDNQWTRGDLATVWVRVMPLENAIWMTGGADWRPALTRSSRSTAGSAALMQKAAAVG
jgi:hypothetical protein